MNRLIKTGTSSTSSLCSLHNQIQRLLDNEAQWARHNEYLQPSVIEPIFHEVFAIMKEYLLAHIQSIQKQQINGSLFYHAKIISKESINLIPEDSNQLDCDYSFLEDQLDRPQISLHSLLDYVQLSDIVEIWKLSRIAIQYRH
ncbi:26017_t:CDS:1 [Gigaspora rosea]|nr:26017_t:CDS:1 [Gigaspora rosea]